MGIFEFLEIHQITYTRVDHPPVFTCEEAERLVPELPGASTKNLFVRDRKGKRHFLIVVPDNKAVDLKALQEQLGCTKLSMGSPERLKAHLGIEPGSVSILAVLNDKDCVVEVVIDNEVWASASWQCHPLVNTSTLVVPQEGIEQFLRLTGHSPQVVEIPER